MKELFPFFKEYKNFICIHAAEEDFANMKEEKLDWIIDRLKSENYIVMIDDAHLLERSTTGKKLIRQLIFNWMILVASQLKRRKDFTNEFLLTELPQIDAIEQIKEMFENESISLARLTPPMQREYFAYRMWFYIGGNMRMLKEQILRQ